MLEATFSPLIPTDNSEEFYKNFYYQYSFIQINDIFIGSMIGCLLPDDEKSLLETLSNYNEDQKKAAVFNIAAGIMNYALIKRTKENRGISTDLFNSLNLKNIKPLNWYKKVIEFLMIYASCEQSIKEYLISKGNKSASIKEDNIIKKLFNELQTSNLRNNFIKELSEGSAEVIKSQNELISAWHYYTIIRHSLVHAGGRMTERIKNKMTETKINNKTEFESISSHMILELDSWEDEDDNFFINPFLNDVVTISDEHLNFFRNMAILIIESLERAIHPNEYEINDFDPYKL